MYLVFAYPNYYPSGGWNDYVGCAQSLEAARALAAEQSYDEVYQIVMGQHKIESGRISDLRKTEQ